MRNREYRLVLKPGADQLLDLPICVDIDRARRLIHLFSNGRPSESATVIAQADCCCTHKQDLGFSQKRPRHANQLTLADRKGVAELADHSIKPAVERADLVRQMDPVQSLPDR